MILTIDIPFEFGQIVFLKTDAEQKPYMVIGVNIDGNNKIMIEIINGTTTSMHHFFEIASEKDQLLSTL